MSSNEMQNDLIAWLKTEVKNMSPVTRDVISYRYGLSPYSGVKSLEETAVYMGNKYHTTVTRERIRQIESKAIRIIRKHMAHI